MVVGYHSRQTLDYNPFRNLIEVSEHAFSARYIVADQNIQATSVLGAGTEPYTIIQESEDAADILSGHNDDGREAIKKTFELRTAFLYEILASFANDEVESKVLFNRCSTFVLSGSGLKSTVGSVDELKQCLDVLSEWLLRSCRE